jgi:DNA polymerase V
MILIFISNRRLQHTTVKFCGPSEIDLFDFADDGLSTENRELMKAIDRINRRFPKAVSIAATGFDKSWKPKADRLSKRYTTDWRALVSVKC